MTTAKNEMTLDTVATSRRSLIKLAGLGAGALGTAGLSTGLAAASSNSSKIDPDALAIMSSNENPFGPSPKAIEAMRAELGNVHRYATPQKQAFEEMIAAKEGVLPEQVLVTNGSAPLLDAFSEWAASLDGELLTSALTFERVPRIARFYGMQINETPLGADMGYDLDKMATRLSKKKTAAVYLCNPNNPTGKTIDPAKLRAFAIEASQIAPVFIDEAYLDASDDYPVGAMSDLVAQGHDVIIARTFSKLYAMAGQRVGYAIMPVGLREKITQSGRAHRGNTLGLVGAMAAYEDAAYFEEMRMRNIRGRNMLVAMAKDLGRPIAPDPQGTFIYMDVGMENAKFAEKMLEKRVKVVGARWPEKPEWTRICVGLDHEIEKCHAAAKAILA